MSAPPARPRPSRPVLPELSILALAVPAIAAAILEGGWPLPTATALAALAAAATSGAERPRWNLWSVPAALLTILLPAAASPGGLEVPILAAASALGLLYWLGRTSRAPSSRAGFARSILVPLLAVVFSAMVALTAPGLSGSSGDAALLAVVALLLIAFLFVDPSSPGDEPAPEGFVAEPPRRALRRGRRSPAGDLRDARTTTKGPS